MASGKPGAVQRKSSGEKVEAREKVADTLDELIRFAFHGRYSFDRDNFSVKRDKKDMVRGSEPRRPTGEDGAVRPIGTSLRLADSGL